MRASIAAYSKRSVLAVVSSFIRHASTPAGPTGVTTGSRLNQRFNTAFERFLGVYDRAVGRVLGRPQLTLALLGVACLASLAIYPRLGLSFFPRTDAGEFVINVKAPSGTRLDESLAREIAQREGIQAIVSAAIDRVDSSYMVTARLVDVPQPIETAHPPEMVHR